jgi:hypothetical protein
MTLEAVYVLVLVVMMVDGSANVESMWDRTLPLDACVQLHDQAYEWASRDIAQHPKVAGFTLQCVPVHPVAKAQS